MNAKPSGKVNTNPYKREINLTSPPPGGSGSKPGYSGSKAGSKPGCSGSKASSKPGCSSSKAGSKPGYNPDLGISEADYWSGYAKICNTLCEYLENKNLTDSQADHLAKEDPYAIFRKAGSESTRLADKELYETFRKERSKAEHMISSKSHSKGEYSADAKAGSSADGSN